MSDGRPRLTVVIPTLDEAEHLPRLLADLRSLEAAVIVVDGGSRDRTPELAAASGARVLRTETGRGLQLRAGGRAAGSDWLLFLHADSRLDADGIAAVQRFLDSARPSQFAHFDFALEGGAFFHRFIEFGQRLRQRLFGLVYGDQGLLVSRELYESVGGHPEWPLMEDVGGIDRLERVGKRRVLAARLVTSARRYERHGRWSGWLRNFGLITLFRLGVSTQRLASFYRPQAESPAARGRAGVRTPASPGTVVAFAKAPTPGRVKTRLAADVGDEEATRIYRVLGRTVVDRLRTGPHRLVVYVDPPEAGAVEQVRAWLGPDLECRLQVDGDLGARMHAAFEECLVESDRVCIVGTDVPELGADTVGRALAALEEADVVLGPAADGGYYLIGMRGLHAHLLRDMRWSTADVFEETKRRAEETNVSFRVLETLRDVDTLADVPQSLTAR